MGNDFVVTVIFCDDVRFEIGGKITLVGIYRGVMGIAPQVAILPKVVAMVMLSGPRSDVGTKFNIRLKDRDTILVSAIVELDQSLQSVADQPLGGLDNRAEQNGVAIHESNVKFCPNIRSWAAQHHHGHNFWQNRDLRCNTHDTAVDSYQRYILRRRQI